MKTTTIVLAAGSGKRMGTTTKKQYLLLNEKPILYYSLKAFEESFIDEIVLVCSPEDISFVNEEIVKRFLISKVSKIVPGGKERYDSVLCGLKAASLDTDYIFIHDGARPMVDEEMLKRGLDAVIKYDACVIGMPSKDTVKIASEDGFVSSTPSRNLVWNIQTPQIFKYSLIKEAYEDVIPRADALSEEGIKITDDAMVLETYLGSKCRVKLVEGSYENIKVTTPEDLKLAEAFLS